MAKMSYEPTVSTSLNKANRYNTDLIKTQSPPLLHATHTPISSSATLERLTALSYGPTFVDDAFFSAPSGYMTGFGSEGNIKSSHPIHRKTTERGHGMYLCCRSSFFINELEGTPPPLEMCAAYRVRQ